VTGQWTLGSGRTITRPDGLQFVIKPVGEPGTYSPADVDFLAEGICRLLNEYTNETAEQRRQAVQGVLSAFRSGMRWSLLDSAVKRLEETWRE
jgi:hypothetical protein